MTFVGVVDDSDQSLWMTYDQYASTDSVDHWLSASYVEREADVSSDPSKALHEAAQDISEQGFSREKGNNAFIDVVYFFQAGSSLIERVGFVFRNHHMTFDGTGTFTYISQFLEDASQYSTPMAPDNSGRLAKASPEKCIMEHIKTELYSADRSAKAEEYRKVVRASNAHALYPATPLNLSSMGVRFAAVRHTFNEADSSTLLRQAKEIKITISQLANASLFVALMKSYPAQRSSKLNYIISINIRKDLGLVDTPYFGNAIGALFALFDCSDLSDNVLCGSPQTREDTLVVLSMANVLNHLIKIRQGDAGLDDIIAFNSFMKTRPPSPRQDLGKQAPVPMGIVSDGVLERSIKRRYTGAALSWNVEKVLMANFDCGSVLQNRSHTFRDCLTLTSAFNPYIWQKEKVEAVVADWASILQFTLRTLTSPAGGEDGKT
ncbi:hypothetical protein CBS101457_000613 [Exobasidium rhododendri]|nr:hypothetical protein CBS101457_000613 [Exobasidium rhododendri]